MNELEMDVRLLRRNLSKGFVSQDKVDELLADLPDAAPRAEWIDHELDETDETEAPEATEDAS